MITTDCEGRIDLMTPVAEYLTGWSAEEARGRRLTEVMCLVNVQTRRPCKSPVEKVLEKGAIVALRTIPFSLPKMVLNASSPTTPLPSRMTGAGSRG